MIEYRAILNKDMKFEGRFSLKRGTFVYVRETSDGWLGVWYSHKGSGHGFALEEEHFSILQSGDCQVQELVVMPDPPDPPERTREEAELARRRLQYQVERHRKTADEIEKLLETV